jgi:hypothetical protein
MFNSTITVRGEVRIVQERAGQTILDTTFANLITDDGLKMLAGATQFWKYALLGSGDSLPDPTNSKLDNYNSDYVAVAEKVPGKNAGNFWSQMKYIFGVGSGVGLWKEFGVSAQPDPGSYQLFNRALFKDSQGNKITIDKRAEDILTIYYFLYFRRSSDLPGFQNFSVDGQAVAIETLLLDGALLHFSENIFKIGANPNVASSLIGTDTTQLNPALLTVRTPLAAADYAVGLPYEEGTTYRYYVYEWPAVVPGLIGEAALSFFDQDESGDVMLRFTPALNKPADKKLRIKVRLDWARL